MSESNVPLLTASPTKTALAKYTNAEGIDIFQTFDSHGKILAGMSENGIIYSGANGLIASIVPLIANIVVTSEQLLDLVNTPVTIVPAPGPNLYIYPQAFVAQYDAGT